MLTATNWLEVGGIAQLAAAAGTLALAGGTLWLAKRTHDVAKKTEHLESASLREAKATEALALEAKTDRQLAYRPQLELMLYSHRNSGDDFTFKVRNAGPGPAFQVTCLAREVENVGVWVLSRLNNLRPGDESIDNETRWSGGGSVFSPFDGIGGTSPGDIVTVVVMCSDVIGRRFRFGQARPVHLPPSDDFLRALPPEISDGPEHSGWAAEPLVWG